MRLHRITGYAGMCGPCALSALTGEPSHECAAAIRAFNGARRIRGVTTEDMYGTIKSLGRFRSRAHSYRRSERPTLKAWLQQYRRGVHRGRYLYIVAAGRHYVVVCNGQIADNGYRFSRRPRPLAEATAFRRALVGSWISVRTA